MSDFWSAWVMVLIVVNLGISLFLFLWAPRVMDATRTEIARSALPISATATVCTASTARRS